jgi:ankyrin repeat protein
MALFKYQPIDLGGPAFRLVRLLKGNDVNIHCELFEAWIHHTQGIIPYEALSYTWGGIEKTDNIMINGSRAYVTQNLYLALQYLRFKDQDRVLWIDAICIDQDNIEERGHQVRQMADIYKEAERVIIWLGLPTGETNFVIDSMKKLQELGIYYACNNDWKTSDGRWLKLWSLVQPELRSIQHEGLESLLGRPWFKRVWILQEVGNAQTAVVVCGRKSVSAGIFALISSLAGKPGPHCQAVLDIMPGPSRRDSWWSQKHDLLTLLQKFRKSEATDPRDSIYALLGMSSDACDIDFLRANYGKSMQEVVHDAISFLLLIREPGYPINYLPDWTVEEFWENLDSFSNAVLIWAAGHGHGVVVKRLLARDDVDVNFEDWNDWGSWGSQTPLSKAAANGHTEVVKLLLARDDVVVSFKDQTGRNNRLPWNNWRSRGSQTPLSRAAESGHVEVVKLLLARDDVDVNSKDWNGRTPLARAAANGHVEVVKLLLARDNVRVNSKDRNGRTPLARATTANGQMEVVKLLGARP